MYGSGVMPGIEKSVGPASRGRYVFLLPWVVAPGSGVTTVVLGLADAMCRRYEPVFVVTGWDAPPPGQIWLKLPAPATGLRDILGFAIRLAPNLFRLWRLGRGAVAVNPHFAGLELLPLAVLRRLGLFPKLIVSVHGSDLSNALQLPRWERRLFSWMLSSADLVVACSHALAAQVRIISPSARAEAVWNGVGARSTPPGPRPMEAPYLVCVAHFVRQKGLDVLLQAFRDIAKVQPALRLVVIGGEGPERPAVETLIEWLGLGNKVHVIVDVPPDEAWRWICYAECLILPSREEAFGIVLLEAGLAGTPVVATRVGGVPEFLTDTVHGSLCEPERPDEIARAVLATLRDTASTEARTRSFRERVKEFTWQRAFDRYRAKAGLP
jgi:glycogen(starch) synthase